MFVAASQTAHGQKVSQLAEQRVCSGIVRVVRRAGDRIMRVMLQTRYAAPWLLVPVLAFSALAGPLAHAQSVAIYSAGSLRAVVAGLQRELASSYGIEVTPTFGGSGLLRERIEH